MAKLTPATKRALKALGQSEVRNARLGHELSEAREQIKAVEASYEHSQQNVVAGREAWELENKLRKQASEAVAAMQAHAASQKDKVAIVLNELAFSQRLTPGDSFIFTYNKTGGYAIEFGPAQLPPHEFK